jgi:hypothetical protein
MFRSGTILLLFDVTLSTRPALSIFMGKIRFRILRLQQTFFRELEEV